MVKRGKRPSAPTSWTRQRVVAMEVWDADPLLDEAQVIASRPGELHATTLLDFCVYALSSTLGVRKR